MIQKVDFFAHQPHYFDHLVNIWEELPELYKNNFYVSGIYKDKYELDLEKYCKNKGYNVIPINGIINTKNLIVVGGLGRNHLGNNLVILINHGAGQSYFPHNSHSYAGGKGRDNVKLFIQPNYYAANADKSRYPGSQQAVVGCSKLDKWHRLKLDGKIKKQTEKPVIAISFHFDCAYCPETRSSWEYYQSILPMLAHKNISNKWQVLGHGHPGIIDQLKPYYKEYGIEIIEDFEEIMERADLYIMDHMSTLYEFASTDRPVVVLNAPWYRREVEHGLRYWKYSDVGINCNHPNDLEKCINLALEDPLEQKMKRERAVNAVYTYRDGMCTERAAKAIVEFLEINENIQQANKILKEDYNIQRLKWLR